MRLRHRLRDDDVDVRAPARLALNCDRAVDLPQDRATNRQTQTVAMRLRGEERLEHPRQIVSRDATPRVGDDDVHDSIGRTDVDHDPATMWCRFARVAEQVQKDLFEIALAAGDGRDVIWYVDVQIDGAAAHAISEDSRRRLDRAPYVALTASPRRVAREGQHAAKNPAADLKRLLHVFEVFGKHGWRHGPAAEVDLHLLDQRQHRAERVVNIVWRAACSI